MPKEIGPREKALREMREANAERGQRDNRAALNRLRGKVAKVAVRKGKSRGRR